MPEMDGIELLRRLHARRAKLPVILITAFAKRASAVAAMRPAPSTTDQAVRQ